MPTSRSRPRGADPGEPPARSALIRPLIPVVIVALLAVVAIALPASLIKRALPPFVVVDDLSGTLWHGTAGRIAVQGRSAGALEWRLHPAALLAFTLAADVHWVDAGFAAYATVDLDRHGITVLDLQGGGPIEDLAGLEVAAGWRGTTNFKFDAIRAVFTGDPSGSAPLRLESARGTLEAPNVAVPSIANGAPLGGYVLHVADGVDIRDTGGPVALDAHLHFDQKERSGTVTGTVAARPGAAAALRNQIDTLGQLHPPDAAGRIPLELEFHF